MKHHKCCTEARGVDIKTTQIEATSAAKAVAVVTPQLENRNFVYYIVTIGYNI